MGEKKNGTAPRAEELINAETEGLETFDARIARLMDAAEATTGSELCKMLGVSRQGFASAKRSQKIPLTWYFNISEIKAVSLDWLYYGLGSRDRNFEMEEREADTDIDEHVLMGVLELVEEELADEEHVDIDKKCRLISALYDLLRTTEGVINKQKARKLISLIKSSSS